MSIEIYEGSILDCDVDAIVNPANGFLMHGAGLARIIADAATNDEGWEEQGQEGADRRTAAQRFRIEQRKVPTIPTGGVAVTSAGVLPYKGIIHAVGPVWDGGHFFERQLLASAHAEALSAAHDNGWKSVAFPAISCGLFRFPVELAAPIAVEAVRPWTELTLGIDVVFALMQDDHIAAYQAALDNLN